MKLTVKIDRPLGTYHPEHKNLYYPVNYGYVPELFANDGEEQDVYVLGVNEPLDTFTGELIAIIHRLDDVEDKWVVAPSEVKFSENEIEEQVSFQEQYFEHKIELV